MWDNFKQPNIWVVEILRGEDRNRKTIQRNDSPKFSKLLIPVVKKKKTLNSAREKRHCVEKNKDKNDSKFLIRNNTRKKIIEEQL